MRRLNLGTFGGLTKPQVEVLTYMGYGFATKEIAVIMKKSPKTVEHHRANLYRIFPALSAPVKLARLAIGFGLSSLCLMCVAAAQPFLVVSNPSPVIQLAWSPGIANVTNYNVYYGVATTQYTNKTAVGVATNTIITLPARGVTYFFAVTEQVSGLESAFSNEVTYTPPNPPPAPTMKTLVVLTVMKSAKPDGVFVGAGMNWSEAPDQPEAVYKLKIDRGLMLSTATPPLPSPLTK